MPSKSEKQRRWAYGVKGKKWAEKHHMDNPGPLPERVKVRKRMRARLRKKRKQ